MDALEKLKEIKKLINSNEVFNYKAVVNYYCIGIKDELDYASKCHKLEEQLDCSLEEAINLLFDGFKFTELYQCITCTSVRHNERGCEGNCEHNKEFSNKEILKILRKYVDYYKGLKNEECE